MTIRALLTAVADAIGIDVRGRTALGAPGLDVECSGVTHDSRRVTPDGVFVALRGLKVNGAAFVPEAVAAGARVVIGEELAAVDAGVPWIGVPDARRALALLSAEFHGHASRRMQVVGVTGTNGKTTTAYLLSEIFEAAGTRSGMLGTVSYRVGGREIEAKRTTPEAPDLQAFMQGMADAGCGACVMEVTSHALSLRRVDGVQFAAGVFTNLTRDHLDFHADMEQYFAAKRRLFEMLPPDAPSIVNADDPRAAALIETAGRPVTYGISRPADVTPGPLSYSMDGLDFEARTPVGTAHVRSKLVGRPNVYNLLAAIAAAVALGIPIGSVERGVQRLTAVPGRFEVVSSGQDDITVVVDYAHTDDALRNLLETARMLAAQRLLTVFGAGGDRDRTKRPLMGMVAARLSDVVVITSDNPRGEDPSRIIDEVKRGADPEARQRGAEIVTVVDRRGAIEHAVSAAQPGDVVLIAGKGHEKYQEVAGQVLAFDDVEVARGALDARRARTGAELS